MFPRRRRVAGRNEPGEREAIVGRVELGLSYVELAQAQNRPTAAAARMAVARALLKLARHMGDDQDAGVSASHVRPGGVRGYGR